MQRENVFLTLLVRTYAFSVDEVDTAYLPSEPCMKGNAPKIMGVD